MKNLLSVPYEPKKLNRFTLKLNGFDAPEFLFKNYKIYNDSEKLIFETEMYEAVMFSVNPVELFEIDGVTLKFLDVTGVVYHTLSFDIKSFNFRTEANYVDNKIATYKFLMEVDKKSMKSDLYKN